MNWLVSCKQAAELLSISQDEPLGLISRLRLRAHLSMCENCRQVEAQFNSLRSLTGQWMEDEAGQRKD
ncbi:MAG: zf-HC2 domain-containing protein [Pseudomonadota bacterium]